MKPFNLPEMFGLCKINQIFERAKYIWFKINTNLNSNLLYIILVRYKKMAPYNLEWRMEYISLIQLFK